MPSSSETLSAAAATLHDKLIDIRRDLHRNPELGFREFRTADLVARRLDMLQLTPHCGLGGTGLFADITGDRPGPTVLLRADMDALPIQEESAGGFSSIVPGVMHACGHDVHTAALLGAAELLTRHRGEIAGRIRVMFQPAEELLQGAAAMIRDGVLDGVHAAISGHVFAGLPLGTIALRAGSMMAGADLFAINICGRAGHGGAPQGAVNPIAAAAQLLAAIPSLLAHESPPGEHLVVNITSVQAGTAPNVVPELLQMTGSIRWYSEALRQRTLTRLTELGQTICQAFRAKFSIELTASVPVTTNASCLLPALTQAIHAAGATPVDIGPRPASEDFALIGQKVPAFYIGIGAGGPDHPPHHCGAFSVDERCIALMSQLFAEGAIRAATSLGP
jgi:amidohydrolase